MKNQNKLIIAFTVVLFAFYGVTSSNAQTNPNHIYHVSTWYMVSGLDSTARAERDAINQEYFNKVTMKNEFVIHQWSMSHFFTEDSREYVIVSEYASLGDIEKAFDRDDELAKQAWPDAKKRAEFMKKMSSYFTSHKDAIFGGMPKQSK